MRLFLDENLPLDAAAVLTNAGHDTATVVGRGLGGAADVDVAAICRAEERALLTLDLDFANTLAYPPSEYFGLVVFRLERQDKQHVLAVISSLIPVLGREELVGRLWVVERERIRVR